ncbi:MULTISPECIES: hypothetical protein [unclassified Methylibium]|jgi:hypothetical protein|uniref:hypothetical protein n=1 Tax=unclassified Methylibium TaxID=2633235 RepID=UPI000A5172A7|nr:hypothetical protein [Methylibium sp. Root1272]
MAKAEAGAARDARPGIDATEGEVATGNATARADADRARHACVLPMTAFVVKHSIKRPAFHAPRRIP